MNPQPRHTERNAWLQRIHLHLLLLTGLMHPSLSTAQPQPLADDFQVNSYTTYGQSTTAAAALPGGEFVVVWGDYFLYGDGRDGGLSGVFAQRLAADGSPIGSDFQVNTYTTYDQGDADVATLANGDFLVVWNSNGQDGDAGGIYGQRYGAAGAPIGGEFQLNAYTTSDQIEPVLAPAGDGSFLAVWTDWWQDGSQQGIFARRFTSAAQPIGDEFQVNTFTYFGQYQPAAAHNPQTDDYLVVWLSRSQGGGTSGIFGQRLDSQGQRIGGEFQVNSYTPGIRVAPDVAINSEGEALVTWSSFMNNGVDGQDGSSEGVFGQRYDAAGSELSGEFQVNTYTTSAQGNARIALTADDGFVVVWRGDGEGDSSGVFGQEVASSGAAIGPEFQISSYTTAAQAGGQPLILEDGSMVVVWNDFGGRDGELLGVFGRRFGLAGVFADGFEAGSTQAWSVTSP